MFYLKDLDFQKIKIELSLIISRKIKYKGVIFIEKEYLEERQVKYEFTYLDYLYYCDRENWRRIVKGEYTIENTDESNKLCVKEESLEYSHEEEKDHIEKTGDKKHDKIFKDILHNKEEIARFISDFIKYEVKAEEIEIYNPNYITKKFEYKNADIIYKIKGKELYFLIEHQTKVDYTMPYRIFNYSLEIIRSVAENNTISKISYKYPVVVPIVIYTGNQKWTANTSFAQSQIEEYEELKMIDVKYRLIDINKYKEEELLEEKTILGNIMILEKCKNNQEVLEHLNMIIKNTKSNKQLQELKRIVSYLYENEEEKYKEEIIKIIEESESEETMSTIAERIGKELAEGRKKAREEGISIGISQGISQGILQNIREIVEKMVNMNLEDDFIKQVTGAKESEIEKIRKKIKN